MNMIGHHMEPKSGSFKAEVYWCCKDFYAHCGYVPVDIIGEGMNGEVVKAVSKNGTNETKAVKTFTKRPEDGGEKNEKMFLHEVAILQNLQHRHILGNIMAFEDPENYIISMPYYPRGTLRSIIHDMTSRMTRKYLVQFTNAFLYLESQRLAHRDIKLSNVLISEDGDVTMTDFGLASVVTSTRMPNTGPCGTDGYIAPELYDKTRQYVNLFKCDLYSLGVVLWKMMVCGEMSLDEEILEGIRTSTFEPGTTLYILKNLLTKDPDTRWDSNDLFINVLILSGGDHYQGIIGLLKSLPSK